MKIAPIDIAHKTFNRKMMGFDPAEVTDFLKSISENMEALVRERNSLKEALREKEMAIIDYKERDELLKSTITNATKMSDRMQMDAEREAKLIINDAHQKADVIVRDSRDSLKRIYSEITELKKIRMQFENNVKAIVDSHMSLLDQGRKIMPNPQINVEFEESLKTNSVSPEVTSATTDEQKIAASVSSAVSQAIR